MKSYWALGVLIVGGVSHANPSEWLDCTVLGTNARISISTQRDASDEPDFVTIHLTLEGDRSAIPSIPAMMHSQLPLRDFSMMENANWYFIPTLGIDDDSTSNDESDYSGILSLDLIDSPTIRGSILYQDSSDGGEPVNKMLILSCTAVN